VTRFLQATVEGLSLASIYALLALGFVIIYKSTQVLSFAQPAFLMVGGYATSYISVTMGVNFWLSILLGVAVAALLAALFERVTVRPMVGKPVFSVAILTIGLDISTRVAVDDLIGVNIRSIGDPWGFKTLKLFDAVVQHRSVATIIAAAIVVGLLAIFFRVSRTGLAMRATALDQETALAQGISVGRIFALAWLLGGALAGLAGLFSATGLAGLSQSNYLLALKALPAVVVGGLDSISGAVVGAVIIGLAEAYTASYQGEFLPFLGSNFSQVVPYVVMVLVLLVRPYGLFGTREVVRV
jgi:branched-chain amino acid transport system permease protein